ncbi:amino acid adenylation domain-containing protein [Paenibacillus alvei A6-6i-x]|nr:amino acid adenylation domain-containing protein [Paenibacillus alvei A6-6i-x]
MTLLAAYQGFLSRYTGQTDITVGSPIANRHYGEIEEMIGFFVNTLVYRADVSANPSFRELVSQVRGKAWKAQEHQDIPFEKIVAALQPERSASYAPLFQTMFTLQSRPSELPMDSDRRMDTISSFMSVSKFDLTLGVQEAEEGMRISFEYSTDLFDASTIERMAAHFERWLHEVVEHPERAIGQMQLISEAETKQQLEIWNRTETAYPRDQVIQELFEEQVAARPEAVAVVDGDRRLTYGELNARANQLAHCLRKKGVKPETLVGICMERSADLIVGIMGILKAGGAYVPMDPSYPQQRLTYMAHDAGIEFLVTQSEACGWVPEPITRICLDSAADQEMLSQESDWNPPAMTTPQNAAYVMYTSGSTGNPKGVVVEQRNVVRLVKQAGYIPFSAEDRMAQTGAIGFDASTFEVFGALLNGGSLYPISRETLLDAPALAAFVHRHQLTTMWLTSPLFNQLVQKDAALFAGLQHLIIGGDALSPVHVNQVLRSSPELSLWNGYGPTENTTFSTCFLIDRERAYEEQIPIGKPIGNSTAYVVNQHNHLNPVGVPGELCLGGDGVARGYLNQPDLTADKFVSNPFVAGERMYRTGDWAKWMPDGNLVYLGRMDKQVKIRGFRIEVGEIETVLSQHPTLRQASVVVREDRPGEKQLAAYLVGEGSAQEWRTYLTERLPSYMVPTYFVQLDSLPLTPNGKIDTRALPIPTVSSWNQEGYAAPQTPAEELVAAVWSQLLGVERIGSNDSFFDLGGHSLLATQAVSRLREVFGVEVAVRDLFQYPTIESLSRRLTLLAQGGEGEKRPPIQAVERGVHMPVSYAQQRLWFLDQLEPNSPLYNIPCAWRLQGAWKLDALEQAYDALIQRHEVLRTVIGEANGEPVQIIREHQPERLPVTNLRHLAREDREREMKSLMQAEADKPFQLAEGPLIRAQAIAMGENDWVLMCTLHHIIFDGWSLDIFVREWLALYEAFAGGQPAELAPLSLQYADYAHWQRNWLSEDVMNRQLAYWEEELGGELPVLQLPTDRPRPAQQSYRGERYEADLPADLLIKLKALSRQEGATLFMTMLAAYQGFLSRYTGQTDIAVGSPIANRHYGEIEEMIGFFVNTLVHRADVSANPSFRELVSQVRGKAWKAQEHQDIPFEKIVAALQPERSASYAPLFQTMFTLQNRPSELPVDSECRMDTISSFMSVSKFDLTVGVQEVEEGMRVSFEYSTDLFDASTIERMAVHFERWLHEVAEHPERSIGQMQLISEAETKQQLEIWNRTETAYPRDPVIQELFEEQAAAQPEAVAVVDEDRQLTYGELNARANQLAHYLRKKGVKPETLVGICMERSADLIVGILGILKAGGAYVPMDPSYPQQRLTYMAHDAGIELMVTQSEASGWVPEPITRICLDSAADQEMLSQESDRNPSIATTPHNMAYLIYTSGTTGNPKGVMVEHHTLINMVFWHQQFYQVTEQDRVSQIASIAFDAAVAEIWPCLSRGASLYVCKESVRTDPEALQDWVVDQQITISFMPTQMAEIMIHLPWPSHTSLRCLLTGGDLLRQSPPASLPFALINNYGPTECTVIATATEVSPLQEGVPPIGGPIANTKLYVLDRHQQPVPIGVVGELYIGGAGVTRGYLNRPELTEERFLPDPFSGESGARMYRTGDAVKYQPDGNLIYVSRIDDQVKIRGFRIELGEIEMVLSQVPAIKQAVVIVREDKNGEKQLAAYLVGEGSAQEWRTYLSERLPSYMVPTYFVQLDSLPLTPNGKIDTRALPIPTVSSQEGYAAPQTPAEELVSAVWSQLLGVERIGIYDSFFELGGHSLLAAQAVSRLREVFGVEVAVRDLFQHPTIESLSRQLTLLAQGGEGEKRPPIQAVERGVHMPASYAQQRLWFLDQLEPNSPLYNIPCAWRLQGAWKLEALEQAYDALLQRHEALRTVIGEANGEPVQIIREHQPERLPMTDLRHLASEDREREMKSLMQEEADKPFQLAEGPLIRAQAIAMGENDWVLLCTLHHIIFDGWSLDIFVREWLALYEAFAGGQPAALAPLSLQYADYAHWQRNWLSEDVMNRQLAYWEEELGGELPVLQLPTDRPRPAQQSYRGELYEVDLPAALLVKLKALSRQEGATLFMTLLAAYQGFLSRYTGQTDIAVGSPIANRHYEEIEGMIGFFVNTLVYRADVSANPSFRELVSQVRGKAWKAQEHQDIPFEKIVAALQPERSASYAPLFQTVFTLQSRPSELPMDSERRMDTISSFMSVAKFDLTVGVQEVEEGMRVSFEYSTDLFDASTIERMAVHFERWLHEVAEHPERSIGQMQLISEAETKQQLEIWNRTETAYPRDPVIQELFEEQAAARPEAVAVVDEDRQLTYGELNARANQLAHYLRKKGVKPETLVGICMERSADLIVGILGILKAGGAYVPMDPSYPQQRLTYMTQDAGIELMVTQSETSGWVPEPITRICLDSAADQEMLSQESDRNPSIATTPHNMAYLIYTSGTTGNPKGVMVEHHTLINMVFWHQQFFQVTEQDRASQIASIAFDAAVAEIWPYLSRGASLHVCKESVRTDPAALQNWVVEQQITIGFMPTQMAEIMIHLPWPSHTSLRCLLTAGDMLRQSPPASLPFALINNYGPTECTVVATATEVSPLQEGIPPIGGPIANTKLYVLDPHQQPVPIGVAGELYIGGAGVTRGYLNRPELTKERFLPDPFSGESGAKMYRTGDAVKYQPDGNLIYVSRIDDQVKIRGFRIELGEIEMVLSQLPAIKQAVVIVREDRPGEKQLAAYLVGEGSAQEWRTYLSERLPSYMVPTYFVQLDSLPLTPNGKIDTKSLPKIDSVLQTSASYIAPRHATERKLVQIWSSVLGMKETSIGVHDSFFDLGGHSMKIMEALAKGLTEGWHVTVKDYYDLQTIQKIAQKIDHGSKKYLHSDTSRLQFLKPPKKDIAHATYDPIGNVLLTGVTGYLGIHLLAELLDGTNSRVYCLIRGRDPRNRLLEQISFYFHDKFEKYKVMLSSRVVIVKGDLSEKQFGLSDAEYAQLDSTISSVIHSAALTKHFGNYADFEKANVTTLEELISFVGRNKRLHYMSTMSVSGHITFGEEQHVFTENDFYVQQNYEDNVYVKSKFWAEHALFQAISNGVDAAIYRVGNLTNRLSDGQHQHNIADNAFMSRFKFMLQHGVASNQFISNDIEFTPVDACSRAVVALIKADASAGENYVFHVYNHHKVGLGEVVHLLHKSGHEIALLDGAAFQDLMLRLSQDDKHIHDIQMLMAAGEQHEGDYAIVKHDSLQTQIALSKAGFYWPKIDELYMQKIVTYLQNSGYLPVNEMRSLIQHV